MVVGVWKKFYCTAKWAFDTIRYRSNRTLIWIKISGRYCAALKLLNIGFTVIGHTQTSIGIDNAPPPPRPPPYQTSSSSLCVQKGAVSYEQIFVFIFHRALSLFVSSTFTSFPNHFHYNLVWIMMMMVIAEHQRSDPSKSPQPSRSNIIIIIVGCFSVHKLVQWGRW